MCKKHWSKMQPIWKTGGPAVKDMRNIAGGQVQCLTCGRWRPVMGDDHFVCPDCQARPKRPSSNLTARQQEIFDWVLAYQLEHHCSPSYREIEDHFGFAHQACQDHMRVIVTKGHLVPVRSAAGLHRGWRKPT